MDPAIVGTQASRVVDAAWAAFERLPRKSKPRSEDGRTEWVPCSAVVVSSHEETRFECVALATGAKCLPASKVAEAQGRVIHDCHAEILAIRIFNRVLIRECERLVERPESGSALIQRCTSNPRNQSSDYRPFEVKDGLKLYLYCSEAPCGDASMELVMAQQDDATPWTNNNSTDGVLKGRGNFSELGVVRRKPARADSPPTLSKSCSDKIALRQCTSLLSASASLLISPANAYLHAIVLPESQMVEKSIARCFSSTGRMKPLDGATWGGGFTFCPFTVLTTDREFYYSRRSVNGGISNVSAAWTTEWEETLVKGVIQGRTTGDPRKASMVSREQTWKGVAAALVRLEDPRAGDVLLSASYAAMKEHAQLAKRRLVKEDATRLALCGWTRNVVDDFPLGINPPPP